MSNSMYAGGDVRLDDLKDGASEAAQAIVALGGASGVTDAAVANQVTNGTQTKAALGAAYVASSQLILSDTRPSNPATGLVRIGLAASGTPDTTAPSTPTGLAVTPGNAQNALSWTASTDNVGVTGYKVRRGGTLIASPTTTNYTDTGLTNGTAYSYTVSAVDAAGNESTQTAAVSGTPTAGTTAPGAPTGLTATAGNAQASLSWTAPASNGGAAITDYVVQYRTSGTTPGAWTTFTHTAQTTTTITVTGLTNGTGYDFQVAAVNSVGTGAYSTTASATPAAPSTVGTDPTTVAGLTALWSVDSLTGVANGAEVLSLPASSGSATSTTFTQVAGYGPAYVTAGQNNLPILRFVGAKYMVQSSAMSAPMSGTDTMFMVARWSTFAATTLLGNDTTANQYALAGFSTNQLTFFDTGSNYTPLTVLSGLTSWHVFAVRRNGTTSGAVQLYVDGTLFASTTASAVTTASQLDLMNNGNNNSVNNSQEFGELAVYAATALTDAQVTGITRFLGNKWGITVA